MPCPPLGTLPDPGVKLVPPALAGGFFTTRATWEALRMRVNVKVRPGIFRVGSFLWEIGGVNSEASHPTELVF